MDILALSHLMYEENDPYITLANNVVKKRYETFMNALGLPLDTAAENARYYALIDLKTVAEAAHGKEFAEWLCKEVGALDFLEQLSRKYGAVLMYGPGSDGPSDSARVSLANLNEEDYIELAERIESLLDD